MIQNSDLVKNLAAPLPPAGDDPDVALTTAVG
jgi:hypothetical protein